MMTPTERDAWLAERMKYTTASDVAAVMGLNKHSSRKKVFEAKVHGKVDNIDFLPVVMAGKYLEDGILQWHLAHRGFTGQGGYGLTPHNTCEALAATPDAIVTDTQGREWVTEIKNVGADKWRDAWAEPNPLTRPDEVWLHAPKYLGMDKAKLFAPVYYWTQLQAQMACLGIDRGRIVVCFGGQARADLDYSADLTFRARMLQEVSEFWATVVAAREMLG